MTRVLGAVLLGWVLVACRVDGLDIGGKQCPCGDGKYTCDTTRNVCVLASELDAAVDPGDLAGADLHDPEVDLGNNGTVQVNIVGAPTGAAVKIVGVPIMCGPLACSFSYPVGETLKLEVVAPPRYYATFEGSCATTGPACDFTVAGSEDVTVTFRQANVVFATSTTGQTGTFGGLSVADAKCQALADQAMLGGTYRAWMSTSTTSAASRLSTANGWIRPDGRPFAISKAALLANGPIYPPQLTETLVALGATDYLATGTKPDGTASGMDATGWTDMYGSVTIGSPHGGPVLWTAFGNTNAISQLHHLCFGIDLDAPLKIVKTPGRRAFVSTATWTPSSGLAAADALCQSNASAAALGGSWKALLPTTTASAASRFDLSKAGWVRVDGIPVLRAAQLATAMVADVPFALLASGTPCASVTNASVVTGAPMPGSVGDATSTCMDWGSTNGTTTQGQAMSTREAFADTRFGTTPCDANASTRVYCLEE